MRNRYFSERFTYVALAAFFGGGLLFTKRFLGIDSAWDYVVLQLLTVMNGLGLGLVLILWIVALRNKKAGAKKAAR